MSRDWAALLVLGLVAACTAPEKESPKADTSATDSTPTGSTTGPPCEPITDGEVWFQDKDGDCLNASLDCDDLDPAINETPGMWQETICDGKDNNCNGQVDEGALDGWYLDLDGDGYSGDEVGACSMPAPWSNDESLYLGVDCNDADANRHPDAYDYSDGPQTGRDIPGDGIDQDCDGVDACAPVCLDDCGFSTEEQAAEFCANFGQAPRLTFSWPAGGSFDLHAADCLCAAPGELGVYAARESESLTLAGIEALWPTEVLYIHGVYYDVPFTFRGFEGFREIPSPIELECSNQEWDLHFTGLANVERMAGLVMNHGYDGCWNTDTAVDLTGLDSLRLVDGDLFLHDTRIQTLHGLEALEEVGGGLNIDGAPDLVDISALAGLRRVGGDLYMIETVDLAPLAGLEVVGGVLNIGGGTLPLFPSLRELGGLQVSNFEELDLTQFAWVPSLPESLDIIECGSSSLSGLDNVTSVGWWLRLVRNPSLTSLDGLESLTAIDGDLLLEDNDSLTSLDALANLTTIDGDLEITGNDRLSRLDGLYGLQHVTGSIRIENNASLTEAEIYAFLDNLGRENIGLSVFVEAVR